MRRFGLFVVIWALLTTPAFAGTQYTLERIGSRSIHGYGFADFINGALDSELTTVPASMPRLTLPGREAGSIYSAETSAVAAHIPCSLTSDIFTPQGDWCADLSVQGLYGYMIDTRNQPYGRFVPYIGASSYNRIKFGLVTEPTWVSQKPEIAAPEVWTVFTNTTPSPIYKIPTGYTGGAGSALRTGYCFMARQAVLHSYGGSVETSSGTRFWWKGSGYWQFVSEYAAAKLPFSFDVTGAIAPPSICTSTPGEYGGIAEQEGNMFATPYGTWTSFYQPDPYGAAVFIKGETWRVVGGVSEDTATVAYYRSNIDLGDTDPLTGWTPVPYPDGSEESSVVVPPDYTGGLPEGGTVDAAWGGQFASGFTSAVDAIMWPFRAFGAWIR